MYIKKYIWVYLWCVWSLNLPQVNCRWVLHNSEDLLLQHTSGDSLTGNQPTNKQEPYINYEYYNIEWYVYRCFLQNICAYVVIFTRASPVNFVYFISFLLSQNGTGMPMCSDQCIKSVSSLEKDKQISKGELGVYICRWKKNVGYYSIR